MHQIFRIIDAYGGDVRFCDQTVTDENRNETTQKVATVYLGALTPFIEELKEKKEQLSPEGFNDYMNTFPKSTAVPSTYIDTIKKYDK